MLAATLLWLTIVTVRLRVVARSTAAVRSRRLATARNDLPPIVVEKLLSLRARHAAERAQAEKLLEGLSPPIPRCHITITTRA